MKVKVRIAVVLSPVGNYEACGSNLLDEKEIMRLTQSKLHSRTAHYWVEAELDVPEVKTVQGDVVSQNEN